MRILFENLHPGRRSVRCWGGTYCLRGKSLKQNCRNSGYTIIQDRKTLLPAGAGPHDRLAASVSENPAALPEASSIGRPQFRAIGDGPARLGLGSREREKP